MHIKSKSRLNGLCLYAGDKSKRKPLLGTTIQGLTEVVSSIQR